tara:strand:+ start:180 stop:452 length:273 start_codon:yes stop_codon:yes gene_type:complete
MPIVKTHLEKSGKEEKFPLGPIVDPKPGPTFEIEVAAPEIAVIKSSPLKDNNAANKKNIIKYIKIKEIIDDINLSSIRFISYFKTKTPFG